MYLTYVFEFSNNSNKNAAKQEIIPLGGWILAVHRIRFYLIVKLPNSFFHSEILAEPYEEINKEENCDVARNTPKVMRHPVHTVCNWQHWYGDDKAVNNRLLQKAPAFHFPNSRRSSESSSIYQGAYCLNDDGIQLVAAKSSQLRHYRIILSLDST